MTLTFGKQDHTRQTGGDQEVHAVVKVGMSWGHLKSMVPLLARMVASYEEQFGEVPAPGFDTMWKD